MNQRNNKELSKYKSKLKLLLLATWSPLKRVKEFEHTRLSKDTHGGEHTNFSQEDWRTRLDLTSWNPKALYFNGFSIRLAFVSLPSFWAV